MKKLMMLAAALLLLLVMTCASAEGEFPPLTEEGFLPEGEFVYENPEEGVWRYASTTLRIEIIRYQTTDPKAIWYEAEIWCTEEEGGMQLFQAFEGKYMSTSKWPEWVARKNGVVFAINHDYAQGRYNAKKTTGVIIRNGKILSRKTFKQGAKTFPNLDVLCLYPDGDMQVYYSNEHTAEEYLEMGVRSTLAFGPILIRDGVYLEDHIKKYGQSSKAPRTAVGMVEKGHYWAMMLEGRHNGSKGGTVTFLAEKLRDHGCTLAFNLDGGETSVMLFMGKQICTVGGSTTGKARRLPEIFGIGVSDLVPDNED